MKNRLAYFPLKIILFFLVFSEILVFIGPIQYDIAKPHLLVLYLIVLNISFYLGYKYSIKIFRPSKCYLSKTLVSTLIILGTIGCVIEWYSLWSSHGISLNLSNVLSAILDPGKVYYSDSVGTSVDIPSIFLLFTICKYAVIPLGIVKWKSLSSPLKCIVILGIFFQIISWLGIGTRKGIFDVFVTIFFSLLLRNQNVFFNKKNKRKLYWGFFLLSTVFILYFVFSNLSRGGIELTDISSDIIHYQLRPFYIEKMPINLVFALTTITAYLCQGYYALSIALSLGILSPKFLSMGWFSIMLANKFGYNSLEGTYIDLLEKYGIDMKINWHTAYVWFANEFTFIFVPIIVFFIGFFLAQTWNDSIHGKNILAFPLTCLFILMGLYLYANNQIFSFAYIPFIFWFILYQISRIKA